MFATLAKRSTRYLLQFKGQKLSFFNQNYTVPWWGWSSSRQPGIRILLVVLLSRGLAAEGDGRVVVGPAHHVEAALSLLRERGGGGGRGGGPKGHVLNGGGWGAVDHGLGGDLVHTLTYTDRYAIGCHCFKLRINVEGRQHGNSMQGTYGFLIKLIPFALRKFFFRIFIRQNISRENILFSS